MLDNHEAEHNIMTMLTAPDMLSEDLGRVVRDDSERIVDLVEAPDWNGDVWAPAEINAGVYCFDRGWLQERIVEIEPSPKGEKYLTSLVPLAAQRGDRIGAVASDMPEEIFGINDRVQLAQVETVMRWQITERLMRSGVTIQDPASVFIDADVAIGIDTVIRTNTCLSGRTVIGEGCEIGPNSVIQDSRIGDGCWVTASNAGRSPPWKRAWTWALSATCDLAPTWKLGFTSAITWRLKRATWDGEYWQATSATWGTPVSAPAPILAPVP